MNLFRRYRGIRRPLTLRQRGVARAVALGWRP